MVPIEEEAGWTPDVGRMLWGRDEFLARKELELPVVRSPPTHSVFTYRAELMTLREPRYLLILLLL